MFLTHLLCLRPFGHNDSITQFFGSPRSLGKSKVDHRHDLATSFHKTGENANAVPQKPGINGIMDVALYHRGVNTKGVPFFNFLLARIHDQDVIDPSPGLLFNGFDSLLKRCVMGKRIRIEPAEPII